MRTKYTWEIQKKRSLQLLDRSSQLLKEAHNFQIEARKFEVKARKFQEARKFEIETKKFRNCEVKLVRKRAKQKKKPICKQITDKRYNKNEATGEEKSKENAGCERNRSIAHKISLRGNL